MRLRLTIKETRDLNEPLFNITYYDYLFTIEQIVIPVQLLLAVYSTFHGGCPAQMSIRRIQEIIDNCADKAREID